MFVDSHCHLTYPELKSQLGVIRDAMVLAKVDRALCICTTIEEFDDVQGLAAAYDNFWCTVGVHPDNEDVHEPTVDELVALSQRPRVVGIGETGLDYYRLEGRTVEQVQWQRDRFAVHIEASKRTGLPLVIHTRSASADTVAMLKERQASNGVFHCFTESMEVARAALDMGFYISFSGILTFKNAVDLREVAKYVPLERCLIETDSPYLAPMPYRGKTNNPSYVPFVAQRIAELKAVAVERVAEATSQNFESLFPLHRGVEKL